MVKLSKEEKHHLHKTINASPVYLKQDSTWIKAFIEYNKSNKPVSMLCRPCYGKVLKFHLNLQ